LEKCLISSGEGKFLPAVAARKLHISGHRSSCGPLVGIVQPNCRIAYKDSFELKNLQRSDDFAHRSHAGCQVKLPFNMLKGG
jgi:hypothetical protein